MTARTGNTDCNRNPDVVEKAKRLLPVDWTYLKGAAEPACNDDHWQDRHTSWVTRKSRAFQRRQQAPVP